MNIILQLMQKFFIFEKEPQRIGLSQFKAKPVQQKTEMSLNTKNIKLSDLMRKVS